MKKLLLLTCLLTWNLVFSQQPNQSNKFKSDDFKQLGALLRTPNVYRTASGAPGPQYWQQQADYDINVTLDEDAKTISGTETITYFNNSPDKLLYLWVQLDQNVRAKNSDTYKIQQKSIDENMRIGEMKNLVPWFDGGFKLEAVTTKGGDSLSYTINKTMMRIDMATPLLPNNAYSFKIKWHYKINDRAEISGRSGYEYFPEEDNAIYTIAQFYPRMAVYNDYEGWQNKQFLGRGEFALPFGNFDVKITVPSDHVLAATGTLQNRGEMLTDTQIKRLTKAETADNPVVIITEEEARENEKGRSTEMKTWHFKAKNVRDFAWASSRKFIWDAQGIQFGDRTVMAMSYYPKEGNPLWGKFATEAVLQTLETYSKHTFAYPYPKAIAVNAAHIGMEYPMICFNHGRSEPDGTYSERAKNGMIGVIIHEVGHNYFPMIVNSDERQWTWLDEGLNSFLEYLTEQNFNRGFPSRRGEPRTIVEYMKGDAATMVPIMTNSESILQFGNNAYGKVAAALTILRETVMGRELFDFAFKTYAHRWMFKHPTPADFFRTMENASAVDLDWFWRGWFFGTNPVDIAIEDVKWFKVSDMSLDSRQAILDAKTEGEAPSITQLRNASIPGRTDRDSTLLDFYSDYNPVTDPIISSRYALRLEQFSDQEQNWLSDDRNFYQIKFSNLGGLVMPIIVQFTYKDGTKEIRQIPAEIWRKGDTSVTKVFATNREVASIQLDPYLQTADIDTGNNAWQGELVLTRFELYKQRPSRERENPMQRAR